MKKIIKSIAVAALLGYTAIASAKMQIIDRVVAIVDSDVVLASELVRRTNTISSQLREQGQVVPPLEKLSEQVLERLVLESLQLQMAKRVGVRISDTELDAMIEGAAGQEKVSSEEFRRKVVSSGTPWTAFREDLRKEVMIARARNGIVSRRILISEKEVENLVEQINAEGDSRTQYSLGHILLPLAENASPSEMDETRQKAQKLVKELREGANFQEYAVTYSSGANALTGGNLGWRNINQLPSLFSGVKNMKVGEVTEPLRSAGGLHIIKLLETQGDIETTVVKQTLARHILIIPDAITDEKAAFDKIQLIRQRIMDGEDFAGLAIEHSDDKGTGALGGKLNWADPGTFVPEFTRTMDALAINEVSKPIKTEFGWHIIEVLDRRDQDQTEDKKRERAYRILHQRKFEEEAQVWIRELKDQAYVKIIDEE